MSGAANVSISERQAAIRQMLDVEYAVRLGKAAALRALRSLRRQVTAAFQDGRDAVLEARHGIVALLPVLRDGMVYAALRGMDRLQRASASERRRGTIRAASSGYGSASEWLTERLEMPGQELALIEKVMDTHALTILREASPAIEKKLQQVLVDIHAQGLHVREGVKTLRKAFDDLGLTEANSYQIENIFRTQTQLAYSAGQARHEQRPEIQDILWGYKFVTAGDSRVRPEHQIFDGTTAPKDDPVWDTINRRNRYSCRCQTISLFAERPVALPPDEMTIDGKVVRPGDKSWGFDPRPLIHG